MTCSFEMRNWRSPTRDLHVEVPNWRSPTRAPQLEVANEGLQLCSMPASRPPSSRCRRQSGAEISIPLRRHCPQAARRSSGARSAWTTATPGAAQTSSALRRPIAPASTGPGSTTVSPSLLVRPQSIPLHGRMIRQQPFFPKSSACLPALCKLLCPPDTPSGKPAHHAARAGRQVGVHPLCHLQHVWAASLQACDVSIPQWL